MYLQFGRSKFRLLHGLNFWQVSGLIIFHNGVVINWLCSFWIIHNFCSCTGISSKVTASEMGLKSLIGLGVISSMMGTIRLPRAEAPQRGAPLLPATTYLSLLHRQENSGEVSIWSEKPSYALCLKHLGIMQSTISKGVARERQCLSLSYIPFLHTTTNCHSASVKKQVDFPMSRVQIATVAKKYSVQKKSCLDAAFLLRYKSSITKFTCYL